VPPVKLVESPGRGTGPVVRRLGLIRERELPAPRGWRAHEWPTPGQLVGLRPRLPRRPPIELPEVRKDQLAGLVQLGRLANPAVVRASAEAGTELPVAQLAV